MLNSRSKGRGQTALEVLFLMGVIFTALVLIVPEYLNGDTDTAILMHVRNAADNACTYLNTGVVIEDNVNAPLNGIIEAANYSSLQCQVSGVGITSSTDTQVSLKVVVVYHSNAVSSSDVKDAVENFITETLKVRGGFSESGGNLHYGKKSVSITVEAVRG
ncbi:hypothetical protein A3L09_08585 [Thermococcus profundus]|uniref:Class III signal peptide-containing protein n=1 Tax=Thermococcus profundus TaxID=49899 RepID=A0A2Z2MN07_THEPR|nr:hypothetical protein [Thermococcus profundus]ASJ03308.1 hypothetical protein A3L09_08585 [Thermococcus profundus]